MTNLNRRHKRACKGSDPACWYPPDYSDEDNGSGGSGTVSPPVTVPPTTISKGKTSYSNRLKTKSTNAVTYSLPLAIQTSYGSRLFMGSSSVKPRLTSQPSHARVTEGRTTEQPTPIHVVSIKRSTILYERKIAKISTEGKATIGTYTISSVTVPDLISKNGTVTLSNISTTTQKCGINISISDRDN